MVILNLVCNLIFLLMNKLNITEYYLVTTFEYSFLNSNKEKGIKYVIKSIHGRMDLESTS